MKHHKLSRRTLLKSSGALAIGLGMASQSVLVQADPDVTFSPDVYHFKVGDVKMTIISDGFLNVPSEFFAGALPSAIQNFLERHFMNPQAITADMNVALMEDDKGLTLIDPGAASFSLGGDPTGGRLIGSLRALGIAPEDIDNVIITHAHPDHLGAFALDFQHPTFPNATHYISRDEWNYWTNLPEAAPELDHGLSQFTAPNLLAVESQAELYAGNPYFWDHIKIVETPGHTIDHKAVLIESQGEQLILTGDAVGNPTLHLKHPDWYLVVDYDVDQVIQSRIGLLDDASDAGMKVLMYHAPFPGLGHIKGSALFDHHWEWIQSR